MPRPKNPTPKKRLNLEFAITVHDRIERVMDKAEADSQTEAIRRALAAYEALLDAAAAGDRIELIARDGSRRQIIGL